MPKRATTIAVAIVGRAITIWEAIQKPLLNFLIKYQLQTLVI
jgi:hypothetical protein